MLRILRQDLNPIIILDKSKYIDYKYDPTLYELDLYHIIIKIQVIL